MEYMQIENNLFNILNNARITEIKANEFKQNLEDIKNYGFTLSKQYFLNGLNREQKKVKNLRLNRIIKKANIKTEIGFFYSERLTSKNGVLFKEKSRRNLVFLKV
jgi:hypothetical protein